MKLKIILSTIAIAAALFGAGCSTIAQGYNNLVHGPTTAAPEERIQDPYKGNSGSATTLPPSRQQVEQAIAINLQGQVQSVRFSMMSGDRARASGRARGILTACDKAEQELKGNKSERAEIIRLAISIIRDAVPKNDTNALKKATDILHKVRGA